MSDRSTDPFADGRRDGDAALYEMLRDVEFADQAFELLAVNLTAYGWGVLCAWLRSGMIFSKCAEQGRPVDELLAETLSAMTGNGGST